MKMALAFLSIFIFTAITVFGLMAMDHGGGHYGCIAARVSGAICPDAGPLAVIGMHLKAFQNFSNAVFNPIFTIFTLAVFVIFFSVFWLLQKNKPGLLVSFQESFKRAVFSFAGQVIRWISLHENSPALI